MGARNRCAPLDARPPTLAKLKLTLAEFRRRRVFRVAAAGQGFRDWIEHGSDLAGLRELPRYRGILTRIG